MAAEERITPIEELRPGLKNVHCIFIVIDKGTQQKTKDGSTVRKCRVADRTGSIIFSVWNDEAEAVETGDIIKLTRGYSSLWKGSLVLYCGKYGVVERLGEFTMVFSETPDMSLVEAATGENSSGRQSTLSDVNGTSFNNHSHAETPPNSDSQHPSSSAGKLRTVAHESEKDTNYSNGHVARHPNRRGIIHQQNAHTMHHHQLTGNRGNRHHPYSRQNNREQSW